MHGDLPGIGCDELHERIEAGGDLVVIDALTPMEYAHSHLPGAVNLTPEFAETRARRLIPNPDTEVVVYCANPECDASVNVAARLVELGYRNVRHYAGGKEEWRAREFQLEGRRA